MDRLAVLMRKMDYQFEQMDILYRALTHRSKGSKNYERLEFLGDSILGFVVAEWLYQNFPKLAEGKLSRMRSSIVRKESLAVVARELNLSDHLILGEGELKSGGFNRDSILSDTVESLIGAIFLDSGLPAAKQFILSKFSSLLTGVSEQSSFKDAKSQLQEHMQKQGLELPRYDIVATSGDPHQQEFMVRCELLDLQLVEHASASSRLVAEQQAAQRLIEILAEQDSAAQLN